MRVREIVEQVATDRGVELPGGWEEFINSDPKKHRKLNSLCKEIRGALDGEDRNDDIEILDYIGQEVRFRLALELGWLDEFLNTTNYRKSGKTPAELLKEFAREVIENDELNINSLFSYAKSMGFSGLKQDIVARVGSLTPEKVKTILVSAGFTEFKELTGHKWHKVTGYHVREFMGKFLDDVRNKKWTYRSLRDNPYMTIDGPLSGSAAEAWLRRNNIKNLAQLKSFTGDHMSYRTSVDGVIIKKRSTLLKILKRFSVFLTTEGKTTWSMSDLSGWSCPNTNILGESITAYIDRVYNMSVYEFIDANLTSEFSDLTFDPKGLPVIRSKRVAREYLGHFMLEQTGEWNLSTLSAWRRDGVSGESIKGWIYENIIRCSTGVGIPAETAWENTFNTLGIDTSNFIYNKSVRESDSSSQAM